ncbi:MULTISPECIES: GlxA family transcriptional regulator [Kitasatospora]|uniref:GlxA family transcriptional regulator n=1 Tax=Kitasatospora TaxID=2063 RepID=UPI000C708A0F|nr:helix-turn-helix domain-containing protein [Kitasatospora sp. GP30]MDH6143685.1 transcriptional regulator GlxA family with amidase domain [Kitasatospora sp. GP30]
MQRARHRVVVLALPGVFPFELGIPAKAFGLARGPGGDRLYEVLTCTPDGRPVRTSEDFSIAVEHDASVIATADTLIVAAIDDPIGGSDPLPEPVAAALGRLRPGSRLVSICTAAFVLAAAGLLDGRPATTHWVHAERFRERYPRTPLDPDVLYVDDEDVLTSAGAAAGMDLCLHLIRSDHGSEIANRVARLCVVPPWRDGGQAQYIARPVPDASGSDTAGAREWALRQLHQPIKLAQLATQAGMSVRTFSRRFLAETGQTPGQWLTTQRLELARRLLESSDLPVDRVAEHAGFGSASSLRQHLAAAIGVSPAAYRRTFQGRDRDLPGRQPVNAVAAG